MPVISEGFECIEIKGVYECSQDLWIRIERDIGILCFEAMYAATDFYCPQLFSGIMPLYTS